MVDALAKMLHELVRSFQQAHQSKFDLSDDVWTVFVDGDRIEEPVEVPSMLSPNIAISAEREDPIPSDPGSYILARSEDAVREGTHS